MSQKIQVSLVGKFSDAIQKALSDIPNIELTVKSEFTGIFTPLTELLILEFSDDYQSVLMKLSDIPIESRPVLLAVIPSEDSQLLRIAMHAGARDYLLQPVDTDNLINTVQGLLSESKGKKRHRKGKVVAVISGNSNAEAAFIAGNLAHITAEMGGSNTVIVDLDLQFSSLPLMLDIELERSLIQALHVSETLDEIAIEAYQTKHKSGLKIMGALENEIALPGETSVEKIRQIISITRRTADNVFINLPQVIDPLSSQVMEEADSIIISVDQSFPCMYYSKGLLKILFNELDISPQKTTLLINHYQKKNKISQKDIEKALGLQSPVVLPYDPSLTAERYSLLLQETAQQSKTLQRLEQLAEQLSGQYFNTNKSIVTRMLEKIGGRSS